MRHTRFDTGVGRRVTERLARACMTQRELAARIGLSYSTVNQMITGRIRPHVGFEADVERLLTPRTKGSTV